MEPRSCGSPPLYSEPSGRLVSGRYSRTLSAGRLQRFFQLKRHVAAAALVRAIFVGSSSFAHQLAHRLEAPHGLASSHGQGRVDRYGGHASVGTLDAKQLVEVARLGLFRSRRGLFGAFVFQGSAHDGSSFRVGAGRIADIECCVDFSTRIV